MWVKICGNTRLEDCLHAAECGADAVGFVFAAGKRRVTPQQVAAIVPHLSASLEKIGVFTTRDADEIIATAQDAGLTGIQIHGPLDLRVARAVRERFHPPADRRIMQVLHWWTDVPPEDQQESLAAECDGVDESGVADALLIDSRTRTESGGTGIPFDWAAAKLALSGLQLPVIVAGGLRPENVAEAIRTLQPYGVDVSSGVELAPGVKDHERVAAFLANARSVASQARAS